MKWYFIIYNSAFSCSKFEVTIAPSFLAGGILHHMDLWVRPNIQKVLQHVPSLWTSNHPPRSMSLGSNWVEALKCVTCKLMSPIMTMSVSKILKCFSKLCESDSNEILWYVSIENHNDKHYVEIWKTVCYMKRTEHIILLPS